MNKKIISAIIILLLIGLFSYLVYKQSHIKNTTQNSNSIESANQAIPNQGEPAPITSEEEASAQDITSPISDAASRITKKSYGTYVTPKNSPVSPEKFTGYHTGVDFEVFEDEKDTDVSINTICSGKLVTKGKATGYGGYAVQACTINGKDVTVVYGHLRQSSITTANGSILETGETIGLLGTGYSTETDNERKHLHLSIHIGSETNIKGYVQNKSELSSWMDSKVVLGL